MKITVQNDEVKGLDIKQMSDEEIEKAAKKRIDEALLLTNVLYKRKKLHKVVDRTLFIKNVGYTLCDQVLQSIADGVKNKHKLAREFAAKLPEQDKDEGVEINEIPEIYGFNVEESMRD